MVSRNKYPLGEREWRESRLGVLSEVGHLLLRVKMQRKLHIIIISGKIGSVAIKKFAKARSISVARRATVKSSRYFCGGVAAQSPYSSYEYQLLKLECWRGSHGNAKAARKPSSSSMHQASFRTWREMKMVAAAWRAAGK